MKRLWSAALFVALSVVALAAPAGCSHSPEAMRARQIESARVARCYSITVYEFGLQPPRRYRVLGPIGIDREDNPALRIRELQQRACELGADAVVDVRETEPLDAVDKNVPVYLGSGPSGAYRSVTAMAVAWLDPDPSPPAPPPSVPLLAPLLTR